MPLMAMHVYATISDAWIGQHNGMHICVVNVVIYAYGMHMCVVSVVIYTYGMHMCVVSVVIHMYV